MKKTTENKVPVLEVADQTEFIRANVGCTYEDYVTRYEKICKRIAELNPSQNIDSGVTFEDLQDVMDAFFRYADCIYKMESEKRYARLCSSAENASNRISELDSRRTSAHNNAMAQGNSLNRWCTGMFGLPKFIDLKESDSRKLWMKEILEVVRQFIAAGEF